MKPYEVKMEIAGNTAMWTRPDTGDCPVSYPAPTYSAVKGIFESVLWGPAIEVVPFKVEICKPLHFHGYATNYHGPLRHPTQIREDNAFQFLATVLTDVCYRMYAYVYPARNKTSLDEKAQRWDNPVPVKTGTHDFKGGAKGCTPRGTPSSGTTSPGHAYAAIFERRLKRGQWFTLPCLGWKEFAPSYVGPFREGCSVQEDINTVLPSMLREVFPDGNSKVRFTYDLNVKITRGVLEYGIKAGESRHD
ncbi:MAG: CRISPR-associated protein Cas5 [Kiritimatiellia bacterium]|jgi:CRISPR-associated protein Cas5d|nr:CRISPR-associated protein Cas5 [Kiritimatiellia bacterium]